MSLSAPTMIIFVISLVVAIIGLIVALGAFAFPISGFWIMTIAYVILAGGCLLKGV